MINKLRSILYIVFTINTVLTTQNKRFAPAFVARDKS